MKITSNSRWGALIHNWMHESVSIRVVDFLFPIVSHTRWGKCEISSSLSVRAHPHNTKAFLHSTGVGVKQCKVIFDFFFSVLSDLLGFFLCWRPLKASETAQIGGQPGYLVDFLIVPWFKGFYKPPMTSDWNIFILFAVFSVLKDTESRKKASYDCKSVIKATERFLKPMKSLKWT